ncbi:Fur-regulated basic protein FbpA [Bacillus sp. BB51/4]|uniref:Fur-regulated basic protein FbpA n=1 Tax=Bacillus sp. BB51/4 TaxID=2217819 RepID=UPI0011EDB663|nr:Fur-regulated basic protein FbpA [Bacillus sp. BB51/4]
MLVIMIVFRTLDRYQFKKQKVIFQLIDKHQIYKANDGRQLYELSMKELLDLLGEQNSNFNRF